MINRRMLSKPAKSSSYDQHLFHVSDWGNPSEMTLIILLCPVSSFMHACSFWIHREMVDEGANAPKLSNLTYAGPEVMFYCFKPTFFFEERKISTLLRLHNTFFRDNNNILLSTSTNIKTWIHPLAWAWMCRSQAPPSHQGKWRHHH